MGTDAAPGNAMGIVVVIVVIQEESNAVHCPIRYLLRLFTYEPRTTFAMSNVLKINCWVLGDEPGRVFTVKIAGSKTVGDLKNAVKEANQYEFPALFLDLWKVSSVRLLIPDI